jgi:hypothetical protein
LLEHVCDAVGGSIPLACQDWANTKAAYRFLSNDLKHLKECELTGGGRSIISDAVSGWPNVPSSFTPRRLGSAALNCRGNCCLTSAQ